MNLSSSLGRVAPPVFLLLAVGCSGDDTTLSPPADGGLDATANDGSVAPDAPSTDGNAVADASSADAGDAGPTDASIDAPFVLVGDGGLLPTLACTTWRYPSPITLEDLEGSDADGFYNSQVWVTSPAAGQVRVIAQPSNGPTFRLYGFDKSTSAVTTLDGPSDTATGIVSVHPFALASSSVSQILLQNEADDGGGATQILAYLIDDAMPMTGPLPSPITISPGFASATAIPFSATTVFDAVTYLESTSGPTVYYGLGVGLATASMEATLAPASLSNVEGDFGSLTAAHGDGNVYVFGSNAPSHPGESAWTVADTAVVPNPVATRVFDTGENGQMIDVAPGATTGATNFAYWTSASDGSSSAVHVGEAFNDELGIVTAPDLLTARTYPGEDVSLSYAISAAVWHGDDMMIIGPAALTAPLTAVDGGEDGGEDGGQQQGARLLWVDAQGDVRAEQLGANALLQNRTGIRLAGASPASVTATSAAWDVAWVETHADGTESLLYNELDCQLGD